MKHNATLLCNAILAFTIVFSINFSAKAQCTAPAMVWQNSVLVSGTALQKDAVYKFPSVTPGVDAFVTVLDAINGATLSDIDNNTFGYSAAWQPVVKTPPVQGASESYVKFRIDFKDSVNGAKHKYDCFQLSFIDVDGDNQNVREFVAVKKPDNWLFSNITVLSFSILEGEVVKALGPIKNYPDIDTTSYVTNVNFRYRNEDKVEEVWVGNKTNESFVVQDRYTCGYFKEVSMPFQVLPVRYSSFYANLVNSNQVNLNWVTDYEQNNSHFEVERSFTTDDFKTVGMVLDGFAGAGNSKTYMFKDISNDLLGKLVIYYRLKQVDRDGKLSYSQVLAVKMQTVSESKILVSPNPFLEKITVSFNAGLNDKAEIDIMNSAGQVFYSQKTNTNKGANRLQFGGLERLPAGIYFARLMVNGAIVETKKIIKN